MEKYALESTYNGLMQVYGYREIVIDGISKEEKVLLLSDIPCALSSTRLPTPFNGDVYQVRYNIKIFCDSKHRIPAGSLLMVEQDGREYCLEHSGKSFVYSTHQELLAEAEY